MSEDSCEYPISDEMKVIFSQIRDGNINKVKNFFMRSQNHININTLYKDEGEVPMSVLHLSVKSGQLKIVKFFVKKMLADINIKDTEGKTPLHYGCDNHLYLDIVQYLLSNRDIKINEKDVDGNTPLHESCYWCRYSIVVTLLLNENIDVNVKNNNGELPEQSCDEEKIKELIELYHSDKLGFIEKFNKIIYYFNIDQMNDDAFIQKRKLIEKYEKMYQNKRKNFLEMIKNVKRIADFYEMKVNLIPVLYKAPLTKVLENFEKYSDFFKEKRIKKDINSFENIYCTITFILKTQSDICDMKSLKENSLWKRFTVVVKYFNIKHIDQIETKFRIINAYKLLIDEKKQKFKKDLLNIKKEYKVLTEFLKNYEKLSYESLVERFAGLKGFNKNAVKNDIASLDRSRDLLLNLLDKGNFKFEGLWDFNGTGRGSLYRRVKNNPEKYVLEYFGKFKNGKREGLGREFHNKTQEVKYYGLFKSNKKSGFGIEMVETNKFFKEKFTGQGELYNEINSALIYKGEFKDGYFSGYGKLYDEISRKIIVQGKFNKGTINSKVYQIRSGKLRYYRKGSWQSGKYIRGLKFSSIRKYDTSRISTKIINNVNREKYLISESKFCEVYVTHNSIYAFKRFLTIDKKRFESLKYEISLLYNISHTNINKLIAVAVDDYLGFVTQLCDCSVMDYIQKKKIVSSNKNELKISMKEKIRILYKTSLGLECVHMNNLVHKNLNWNNVLLTKAPEREIKVSDIGVIKFRNDRTPMIISPEQRVKTKIKFSKSTDIYCFGTMIFQLLFETNELYKEELVKEDETNKIFVEIMRECLENDPRKRPNNFSLIVKRMCDYIYGNAELLEYIITGNIRLNEKSETELQEELQLLKENLKRKQVMIKTKSQTINDKIKVISELKHSIKDCENKVEKAEEQLKKEKREHRIQTTRLNEIIKILKEKTKDSTNMIKRLKEREENLEKELIKKNKMYKKKDKQYTALKKKHKEKLNYYQKQVKLLLSKDNNDDLEDDDLDDDDGNDLIESY